MVTRVPQEPGRPCRLHRSLPAGATGYQLRAIRGPASAADGDETTDATVVSPSEGNEVRREGRQGVGAPHSTVEAGEPSRGTPRREGDAVS